MDALLLLIQIAALLGVFVAVVLVVGDDPRQDGRDDVFRFPNVR